MRREAFEAVTYLELLVRNTGAWSGSSTVMVEVATLRELHEELALRHRVCLELCDEIDRMKARAL